MILYDETTKTLSMIAKDTGDFVISLKNYLLDEGDTVYFTVNDGVERGKPRIQKIITQFNDHKAFVRLSTDDSDIPIGNYLYDIQVSAADGRVDTVLGPRMF
jgi:hypothetical protein